MAIPFIVNKLLSEFILVAMLAFPHGTKAGKFIIVDRSGRQVEVSFSRADVSSIVEGAHEYKVIVESGEPSEITYRFIDNGLYGIKYGNSEKVHTLDIIDYLVKLDRKNILSNKQVLNIKGWEKIAITPGKDWVVLSLTGKGISILVDKGQLR